MRYLTILFLLLLFSCKENTEKVDSNSSPKRSLNSDTLTLPIDTIRLLKSINMKYGMQVPSLKKEIGEFDTIEVYDLMYACDCPSWFPTGKNYDSLTDFGVNDTISVYIEPGNSQLYIDPNTSALGNNFRFFGKITDYNGLPKYNDFMRDDPPKGKVFTYFGYERILPHKIYGPHVYKISYNGNTEVSILTLSEKHVQSGQSIFE